jgi:hypothetical protein
MLVSSVAQSNDPSLEKFGISFIEITNQHMQWRDRLKEQINGTTSEAWLARDATQYDRCALGRWLRSTARAQFGHLPSFRDLEMAHAEFHYFAGAILTKAGQKETGRAEQILKNEFAQATRRLMVAINEINALPDC